MSDLIEKLVQLAESWEMFAEEHKLHPAWYGVQCETLLDCAYELRETLQES